MVGGRRAGTRCRRALLVRACQRPPASHARRGRREQNCPCHCLTPALV